MTTLELLEGSEAIADAAISAGMRFYAGYPMSPATDLLEHIARKLPEAGGVCINADTEIEGVMMALGAAATGARAATGSTGQGVSLMQEAVGEAALSEIPLVIFTMARAQQDYRQATRGGGWGDYNTIALAPKDVYEGVELTQLAFHLADKYRAPTILLGDNIIARTHVGVDTKARQFEPLPPKDWALTGKSSGTGEAKSLWAWGINKHNTATGTDVNYHWNNLVEKFRRAEADEQRWEEGFVDDAGLVVVAFGSAGKFVEYVVRELRESGKKVGFFRPITIWPFPGEPLARATANAKRVAVFELNAGQMVFDVKYHVRDRSKVMSIGGISSDESGLNLGPMLTGAEVRRRILAAYEEIRA
jgi:2-oxoglutarate ferredoxin oxidoreductase subunit alpha